MALFCKSLFFSGQGMAHRPSLPCSIQGNGFHSIRDLFTGVCKRLLNDTIHPTAARHLHSNQRNILNVVLLKNCAQLFFVRCIIQLWASDQRDSSLHKGRVKFMIGIGCTICSNEQACPLIIRRLDGGQLNLYRPLHQSAA